MLLYTGVLQGYLSASRFGTRSPESCRLYQNHNIRMSTMRISQQHYATESRNPHVEPGFQG
jgi:hypothetical protein